MGLALLAGGILYFLLGQGLIETLIIVSCLIVVGWLSLIIFWLIVKGLSQPRRADIGLRRQRWWAWR